VSPHVGISERERERVCVCVFIGTQFSILYTSMYSPAGAASRGPYTKET